MIELTVANDGQTVAVKVGQSVELILVTSGIQWGRGITETPEGLLAADPAPSPPPDGARLIWTAVAPGTVKVTAIGTAKCSAGQICPQFARLFAVTLVIS